MAGVIREATKFRNQQIGVVKASRGAVDVQDAVTKFANDLTGIAVKEAGIEAERTGKDFAKNLTEKELRTINPKTGMPEAFDAMPKSYGRIARNAFQDTVNTQYEQSIASEIQAMAKRAEALYPTDPHKYATEFQKNINVMKTHATGMYSNLIDRYGGTYLASTKLNIQAAQIKKANQHLAENTSLNSVTDGQTITSMFASGASDQDIVSLYDQGLNKIKTADDAGVLTPKVKAAAISELNNAMILGSMNKYIIGGKAIGNAKDRALITGTKNKRNLFNYLQAPTDSKLTKFDNTIIVAPQRTIVDQSGKQITLPAMTMRDYAQNLLSRIEKLQNRKPVDAFVKDDVVTSTTIDNEAEDETNNIKANNENNIVNRANTTNRTDVENYAPNNIVEFSNQLANTVKKLNKTWNQTTPPATGGDAELSTDNHQDIVKKVYEDTTYKVFNHIASKYKDDSKKQQLLIAELKTALSLGPANRQPYEGLRKSAKAIITKEDWAVLQETYDKFDGVSGDLNFHTVADEIFSSQSSDQITSNNLVQEVENETLAVEKAKKSNMLQRKIEDSDKKLTAANNVDIINDSSALGELIANINKEYDKYIQEHEKLLDKSPYNRNEIIKARDAEISAVIRGSFGSLLNNTETKFIFKDSDNKDVERTLTTLDIDRIGDAFITGKVDDKLVPKEFIPLLTEIAKSKTLFAFDASSAVMAEIRSSFDAAKSNTTKKNNTLNAITSVNNRVDETNPHIDEVMSNAIWKGVEEDPTKRNPSWWQVTPITTTENGVTTVHPLWENTINFAMRNNRLPKGLVAHLNNLGNGRLPTITQGMGDEAKARVLLMTNNAVNLFKMLSAVEIDNNGSPEIIDLLSGNKLIGHKVDNKAMDKIREALKIANIDGASPTQILDQIAKYNDDTIREQRSKVFYNTIKVNAKNDDDTNYPKNTSEALQLITKNIRVIDDLLPWANEQIMIGSITTLDEFKTIVGEKVKEYQIPSTVVFSPISEGGSWDGKNGQMVSPFGLSKRLTPKKIEQFLRRGGERLPEGYSFARVVTQDYIGKATIGEQQPRADISIMAGGVNRDWAGKFKPRDEFGNTPVYLMPIAGSNMSGKITYRAITVANNNGTLEMKYVIDDTTENGFIEFTIDNELIDSPDPLTDEEKIEEVEANIDLTDGKLKKLEKNPAFNANTDEGKNLKNIHKELKAELNSLERDKTILTSPPSETVTKDNSVVVGDNTNIVDNAVELLMVQEDFRHTKYKDGKDFSIGHGFYLPSLTRDERALIKNINYVKRDEAKAVLKLKVQKIRKGWINLTNNNFGKLPVKTRTALISMAYQLDLSNIAGSRKNKSWPLFLKSVKKATEFDLSSAEQKKHLLEASKHMLHNFHPDGTIKSSTKWHKQTPNRAKEMAKAVSGQ